MNKFLKFTYWNSCDLDKVVFSNSFRFWFFLDALVTEPEEIEFTEVEKDGEEKDVITFRKVLKRYKIVTPLIPEYMVDAINRMRIHDNIQITFLNGEALLLTKDQVNTETEYFDESTCFAKVTITFDVDESVVKTNCCAVVSSECVTEEACAVMGVLWFTDYLTWTDILAHYPYTVANDIFLLLVHIPGQPGKGYVHASEGNGLCKITAKGVDDYAVWTCNQCSLDNTGKMILTADGDYWYNDGYYWLNLFTCNVITNYAVIPPPAYNWMTVISGYSLPGTFVQLQSSPDGVNWTDFGNPGTADEYRTTGIGTYHSLTGGYYFRAKCYNYNCDYESLAKTSILVIFP